MSVVPPEHLKLIQRAVEQFHGFKNCSIDCKTGSENGGHYLGIIVTVVAKKKDGGNEAVNLILKMADSSEKARRKRAILAAFERELQMYDNILPELLKFQITQSISEPFRGSAKFYGGSLQDKKEAILMQDLRSSGYRLTNPMEPMDFDHMTLIFREYAKFHAISLALRHKHPDIFVNLTKNIGLNFLEQREAENPERYRRLMRVVVEMGAKAVQGNRTAEGAQRKFEEILPQFWKENKESPEKEIIVVSHGDCHPNNIMFQYKGAESKPDKICFIDWQLSSVESPIHDISFVLFACASKVVLERSGQLLRIYWDTIATNLKEFGCDPNEVFSYDNFLLHWKKHFLHGLYRAQMALKLILVIERERSELGETTAILDTLRLPFSPDSNFARRIKDLFETIEESWL